MQLILWRHADAAMGAPDLERPLTALGRRQAAQVAAWLDPRLPERTRILCSPALRTRQTVEALGRDYTIASAAAPGADPAALLRALHWPHGHGTLLLVGHQPTLGQIAALLLAGRAQEWEVPRAGLWWFSRHEGGAPHGALLRAVLTPDLLAG